MINETLVQPGIDFLSNYAARLRAFRPNARLFLLNVILIGAVMGIFRLLFNFYLLSLGYDEAMAGQLTTVSSLTTLIAALPLGYLADRLGRKPALLLSGLVSALALMAMWAWPTQAMLYFSNVLLGLAQGMGAATIGPFLMENSSDDERTYLFSFHQGLSMLMTSVGSWVGGYMPGWMGNLLLVEATSSRAYGAVLLIVGLGSLFAVLPFFLLKTPHLARGEKSLFTPIKYAMENPVLLGKLIGPMLVTSFGAGLIMPFMNLFFRQVYHQPDPVIGSLFAWGSLAMGIGLLAAPPMAERMGKIRLVVITQALSIPFLALLGFAPWFWMSAGAYYIRVALMNMSTPVYQTYVMEHVDPGARATVASLISMAWSFGWAFSPMASGWIQVRYGFGPAYIGTIVLYTISVFMYWAFFWRKK
jgi:MFS family permease